MPNKRRPKFHSLESENINQFREIDRSIDRLGRSSGLTSENERNNSQMVFVRTNDKCFGIVIVNAIAQSNIIKIFLSISDQNDEKPVAGET